MKCLLGFMPGISWTLALFALVVAWSGCQPNVAQQMQGYIEGEFVYVAAPLAGQLESLSVKKGDMITDGQTLFVLEHRADLAVRDEASNRLAQAQARLANLMKGQRPSEVASLEARLEQAKASLKLSEAEFRRGEKLIAQGVASKSEFDRMRSAYERDQRLVEQGTSDLATARLGARQDEVVAAEADVAAMRATLAKAQWSVDQKQQAAQTNALVFDTLYRPGEFIPAGMPVVALLPPTHVKVRFFLPQTRLGEVKTGQTITVHPDGAAQTYSATIRYISPQAEYTPPVLYTSQNRAKLVFMLEAFFDQTDPTVLHPGQPVDVALKP